MQERGAPPEEGSDPAQERDARPRHDPATPHTSPFPSHVPRWLAWILLVAFAASGAVCVRVVLGG